MIGLAIALMTVQIAIKYLNSMRQERG